MPDESDDFEFVKLVALVFAVLDQVLTFVHSPLTFFCSFWVTIIFVAPLRPVIILLHVAVFEMIFNVLLIYETYSYLKIASSRVSSSDA